MGWFPFGPDDNDNWRLDIVALLAVTGESFIGEHAQALTSSKLCLLPRIMPAPHALLQLRRPASLPSEAAKVVGVHSGVLMDTVGFFANIMHPIDQLRPFQFRVLEIKHRGYEASNTSKGGYLSGSSNDFQASADSGNNNLRERRDTSSNSGDEELAAGPVPVPGVIRRRKTVSAKFAGFLSNAPLLGHGQHRASGIPSFTAPLHLVSVVSFLMTIGLIVAGVLWRDGTAVIAVSLLSAATSVIGYAARWKPYLLGRGSSKIDLPRGDVVIRTREGAFLVVKCTEEVARELYWGAQECNYMVEGSEYRVYMTISAVLMMPSVILLGNCSFNMQLLCGGALLLLNIAYWLLGLLPLEKSWDLSQYEVNDLTPSDAKWVSPLHDDPDSGPSYTLSLWFAIREFGGRAEWVELSGAMPSTPLWKKWLAEAVEAAQSGNRAWDAVGRKNEIMSGSKNNLMRKTTSSSTEGHGPDR